MRLKAWMTAGAAVVTAAAGAEAATMNYLAAWSAAKTYAVGSVVVYGNEVYYATGASLNAIPSPVSKLWKLIGRNGMDYKGAWSATTTYHVGAVVTYREQTYYSLLAGNLKQNPAERPNFWVPLGTTGNTIRSGSGAPLAAQGVAGDFWIDTTAKVIYGPRTATGWPLIGTSLIGPRGATGAAGAIGPSGPQGATGAPGTTGPQGATGAPGATGAAGTAGPQGATGAAGTAGPQGATGAAGTAGSKGATGAPGATGSQGATGPLGNPLPAGVSAWATGSWMLTTGAAYLASPAATTVTIGPSGKAVVFLGQSTQSTTGTVCKSSFSILTSDGQTIAPDGYSRGLVTSGTAALPASTFFPVSGLPAGSTTFTMQLSSPVSAVCYWYETSILVIPQ